MEPRPVVIDPPENVNTGSPSSTMVAALFRSALSVLATLVVAFGTNYLLLRGDLPRSEVFEIAIITAGVTALAPFATRGVSEGLWDANRQKTGNAEPADVTPTPTP